MVISMVGYVGYNPRNRTVRDKDDHTYFKLTTDPYDQDDKVASFNVQVYDPDLRKYVNTHLRKGLKVYVTGEYSESFSIICGTLFSNQKIKAYGIEIVKTKETHTSNRSEHRNY